MNYDDLLRDFARRTRRNLEELRTLQRSNPKAEVYEVTQLVNSMLGLLVFPQQLYINRIPKTPLSDLVSKGWAIPEVRGNYPQVENLNQLVRYLRNAISHCNLEFLSDGDGNIRGLTVWNTNPRTKAITWRAELTVDDIEKIANKFTDLLIDDTDVSTRPKDDQLTNEILPGLKLFEFSSAEAEALHSEFEPILVGTDFSRSQRVSAVLSIYKGAQGIYFWVMRWQTFEYKIYLGKTRSLADRLLNYLSEFQPHSPNDYKLRTFQAFAVTQMPDAGFDLYFAKKDPSHLTEAENEAIGAYKPFLNQLALPTAEVKAQLKQAFTSYYQSTFEQRLRS
jgi:hypothetical protein